LSGLLIITAAFGYFIADRMQPCGEVILGFGGFCSAAELIIIKKIKDRLSSL